MIFEKICIGCAPALLRGYIKDLKELMDYIAEAENVVIMVKATIALFIELLIVWVLFY